MRLKSSRRSPLMFMSPGCHPNSARAQRPADRHAEAHEAWATRSASRVGDNRRRSSPTPLCLAPSGGFAPGQPQARSVELRGRGKGTRLVEQLVDGRLAAALGDTCDEGPAALDLLAVEQQ